MGAQPAIVLDLMIYMCEVAHQAMDSYGMNIESFHNSVARNVAATLNYAVKHDRCKKEEARLKALCDFVHSDIAYGAYYFAADAVDAFMGTIGD